MNRDEMSILYRGLFIDASYQVLVHLAKRFQRRSFLRNQTIRKKNCLWRPCLTTDRDEMSNPYGGPSINASYHVLVHLAKRFQRRTFFGINQSETRIVCRCHLCWRIGTKWAIFIKNFQRCILASCGSFSQAVSEEKIFLEIDQSETRIACGGNVC